MRSSSRALQFWNCMHLRALHGIIAPAHHSLLQGLLDDILHLAPPEDESLRVQPDTRCTCPRLSFSFPRNQLSLTSPYPFESVMKVFSYNVCFCGCVEDAGSTALVDRGRVTPGCEDPTA